MSAAAPTGPAALELRGITKDFSAVRALDGVDFRADPGKVHALLGENGAGKSTLMRVAFGMLAPDAGARFLFGRRQERLTVRHAMRAGVGMVHQHLSLVPRLTTLENLVLGGSGLYVPRRAKSLLDRLTAASGLSVPWDALASDLSIVEQQRLEILKALARGARVLILDEPTAVLAPSEIDDLLGWIRRFAGQGGSVVLVTHKLREALAVADEVTVLRRGRVVHRGAAALSSEDQLADSMFADDGSAAAGTAERPPGEVIVDVRNAQVTDERGAVRVRDVTMAVRRHEIVGVAAIEGSGHRELLSALAGLRKLSGGTVRVPASIGFIPADRQRDGLILDLTLSENYALRGAGARSGLMRWRDIEARATESFRRFALVAPSGGVTARRLSGGNQQRVVVARELGDDVDLVIADNPTRGLDVRSSAFVHDSLRAAARRGAAVIVHSSDLDELLDLATRMVVMFHGEAWDVPADRGVVGRAMLGVHDGGRSAAGDLLS